MFKKANITNRLIKGVNRFFQVTLFSNQSSNILQYHSGGDDYNPPENTETLCETIGNNPAHGITFVYKDSIERKSAPGEKRIYATETNGGKVVAEFHLKNNGDVVITATGKIISTGTWEHNGNMKIKGDSEITGTLKGGTVIAGNGSSGTYANSVSAKNGIVTGGS